MKKMLAILFAAALVPGAGAGSATAAPINITVDATGTLLNAPVGIATDAEYDAIIGGNGNSAAKNLVFLQALIANWNGKFDPDLPAPGPSALYPPSDDSLGDVSSYTGPAGYQYVVFHWGNSAGSPGGFYGAYYLGGEAISIPTLPKVGGNTIGGFSSARYFGTTRVPEGGATLLLLGGALVGVGILRRKFSA